MSSDGVELPDGWMRVEDSNEQAGQYAPQQPIRYRREKIEIHIQSMANVTDAEDVWRLGAIPLDGTDGTETLREGIEGRDTAIEAAREFMETYNDRCVNGNESRDAVISSF